MKLFVRLVLLIGFAGACSSPNAVAPNGPRLLISLPAAQVSAVRGSRLAIAAEVTRLDGAASTVTVTVTAPTGVTASVANAVTNGTSTTVSLSIVVGATTLPGQYALVIRAQAVGYPDATAQLVVDLNDLPPP